jgi:predicted nuclease of predicted toxin-antitoxin system
MRFLADESIDAPIVAVLRDDGHEVEYVAEMSPSIPDEEVLARVNEMRSLLLTGDKDFGELVFRLHRVIGISHDGACHLHTKVDGSSDDG